MDIPDDKNAVRKEIKRLLYKCNKMTDRKFVKNFVPLEAEKFSKVAKTVNRILVICKNVMPSRAFNDDNIGKHVRTLLKNECLSSIKNYTLGLPENGNDYVDDIRSTINTYSLASTDAKPLKFYSDYYASALAFNDNFCCSINTWDAEDRYSYFMKEIFTFDFKIRTLVTAFQHKYSGLYLYNHRSKLADLVPGIDENGVAIWSRHDLPSEVLNDLRMDDAPRIKVKGEEGFWEERLSH